MLASHAEQALKRVRGASGAGSYGVIVLAADAFYNLVQHLVAGSVDLLLFRRADGAYPSTRRHGISFATPLLISPSTHPHPRGEP
jgi:hypothetical protein